ncbi:unnamed protein product [Lactuca virosa]|uniref:C2 NT-type domain-containing protein n=1 Tax=Lactuca virosa TaxID=75947 RepID=A0AAU9MLI6_9ASTR|nr:unnamed protein product [Lactuca virosa]
MDTLKALHFELKIMNAKNDQVTNSNGYFFVRCYLSAGNNKRVRLDSQEVSPNKEFSMSESFSLDCIGTKQSMDMIIHGTIVLELRLRSFTAAMFRGSQLVGRTELSWRDVFESPSMQMESWVIMKSKKKDVKAPSVLIAMKIETPFSCGVDLIERKRKNKWDERCGCSHADCSQNTCLDGELFAIGGALDAF